MKLSALTPDARNANKGTARGRKLVRESLKRYGAGRSILLDRNGSIIAGNKTVEGATALGMEDVQIVKSDGTKLIAVQRTDLDINDRKARELAIADNRASEVGLDWDLDVLKELKVEDVDLAPFWDDQEIEGLLGIAGPEAPEPKLDQAAELQRKWGTQRGQLWLIGPHRLLCGDSTSRADVDRVWGSVLQKTGLLLTDPPYGIDIVKGSRIGSSQPQPLGFIEGAKAPGFKGHVGARGLVPARLYSPIEGDKEPFEPAPLLGLCAGHVIFGANHFASKLPEAKGWIVWDKGTAPGNTFSDAELAWCDVGGHVRMYRHTWAGLVREGSRDIELADRVHPTQKPVGLFKQILEDYSAKGEAVLDLYLGSGSVMVACELTHRVCYALEIEPKYVAVCLQRLADMGLKPELSHG